MWGQRGVTLCARCCSGHPPGAGHQQGGPTSHAEPDGAQIVTGSSLGSSAPARPGEGQPTTVTPKALLPPPTSPELSRSSSSRKPRHRPPPPSPVPQPHRDTRTCTESRRTPGPCPSSSWIHLKPTVSHRDVYLITVHCCFFSTPLVCVVPSFPLAAGTGQGTQLCLLGTIVSLPSWPRLPPAEEAAKGRTCLPGG